MKMTSGRKQLSYKLLVLLFGIVVNSLTAQTPDDSVKFEPYSQEISGTEVAFKMTPIQGGEFLLGSPESEANRKEDEGPQKKVKVEPFWMGVYEVTFDEYEIFRDKEKDKWSGEEGQQKADAVTRPSPPYEDPTFGMGKYGFPAGSMTQYAALLYCKWLSDKTGVFYRLPTEAEWEYACKAGKENAFPMGNEEANLDEYGWYYENSDDVYQKVGTKNPNEWGLYDMNGNVAEWTLDQYAADYYASLGDTILQEVWAKPSKLHPRSVRGGSYTDDPEDCRCASRTESSMNWKKRDPQIPKSFWWNTDSPFVGFRLVRPFKQPSPEEIRRFWAINLDE